MSEENPFKTISSKSVYQNPWIEVREDSIIKPNGQAGIYGVVSCKPATGIIPIFEDHSTLLVGQYRYTLDHYSWEIIEGGVEGDETPKQAAIRELKEEGGYLVSEAEQILGEIHLSNSHSSEKGYLYIAYNPIKCESAPEDTEILQIKRLPIVDALDLVERGEIQDSLSIIGLYRVARILKII